MWEGVGDRSELQHIDPHSIDHNRVSFQFSWAAQRGAKGPTSLSAGFLYCILSPTRLIPHCNWSPNAIAQSGAWGLPLQGAGFLYRIFSPTHLVSKLLNFLCTELYNSSTSTQSPPITGHWNGMLDRHRAEITVMQFTGHSLPVHMFVTVPWDFNPVPYCVCVLVFVYKCTDLKKKKLKIKLYSKDNFIYIWIINQCLTFRLLHRTIIKAINMWSCIFRIIVRGNIRWLFSLHHQ